MTVGELVEKLQAWPQDAKVAAATPNFGTLADVRSIRDVEYWAAYNQAYVVID